MKTDSFSKYHNAKIVTGDGQKFDSKREFRRWNELIMLERAGEICKLKRQVTFPIEMSGVKICRYIADFTYEEKGRLIVEDVKSPFTARNPVYRLKKKLMFAVHGITIKES